MEIVNSQLVHLNVRPENVLMPQHHLLLMKNAKPIKMDVLQQVKVVYWQQQYLYVQLIQEIIQLVLDILDQMEFVKVMLEVQIAELENAKMVHLKPIDYVNSIKVVVRLTVKIAFQHYQLVILIRGMQLFVLHILVLMDIVKETI